MPVEFQISDSDIAFAESVLLPTGANFDEERRQFIKCLNTADLQAVPGSGKTTALLAKLLSLERHLSLQESQGVLVISHTNAAVNEIRKRIEAICPNLFTYPNFVGTIQSFVDSFLAIPSFVNKFGFRPSRIDADAYNAEVARQYKYLNWHAKKWIERNKGADTQVEFTQRLRFDPDLNITKGLGGRVLLKNSDKPSYKAIRSLKFKIFKIGLLHFEDVFLFAGRLLKRDSLAKNLLQKRFNFVFVDEMQDMAPHQYGILEDLFAPNLEANTVFQRIGDTDQAIFGESHVVDTDGWIPRNKTLTLSNSLRLSATVATILAPFAYEKNASFEITGLQESRILPHILIYDDNSIGKVLECYAELIAKLRLDGSIQTGTPERFTAIAWNSDRKGDPDSRKQKLRLIDFCPNFKKSTLTKQEEFEALADYLYGIDPDDKTLRSARNGILRATCRALRLEDIVDPRSKRPFNPRSLVSYFRFELEEKSYSRINKTLLKLSINLVKDETKTTLYALRKFIPKLVRDFGGTLKNSLEFLSGVRTLTNSSPPDKAHDNNSVTFGNIQIDLGTVHSVKGQTHTATLYIESAYYNDGGKKYESQRLAAQFKGERMRANIGKRIKESAKMVYVGFSRPTHLLAFAVHKKNFDSHLFDIDTSRWRVIEVYSNGNSNRS